MGFSRQEYWSGLSCPPPGDLPNPGSKPTPLMSPAFVGGFFTTSATWEAPYILYTIHLSTLFKHKHTWNFKYNKILNPDRKVFESLFLEDDQCFGISCANLHRQLTMIYLYSFINISPTVTLARVQEKRQRRHMYHTFKYLKIEIKLINYLIWCILDNTMGLRKHHYEQS